MTRSVAAALLALVLGSSSTSAQAPVAERRETGLPFLRGWSPREYAAQPQNWAIAQDLRGVIYIGNTNGVLEFDGLRFRLIPISNNTTARSLAVDSKGRVYVGAVGEVGTLEPDATGRMRYVSLLARVPPEARDFSDVFQTFATQEGVVFSSFERLIRLQGTEVQVFKPQKAFHFSFFVGGRLFIRDEGRGLMELRDGRLQLVPGGDRFAEERIYAMLPWGDAGTILIGSRTQGLFVYDGASFRPFPTEVDAGLKHDLLFSGVRLPDGGVALGTIQGGLYVIDPRGRSRGRLDKARGLPDDCVWSQFVDAEGGLWLGLDRGVARIETGPSLTRYDERAGLPGLVICINRHRERLYVGTTQGLFRLEPGPEARFIAIPGIKNQTWALLSAGDTLLVANNDGVYTVDAGKAVLVQKGDGVSALHASRASPGRVFAGLTNGVASLRREGERFVDEGEIPGVTGDARTILEMPDGRVWVGTHATGMLRLTFPRVGPGPRADPPRVERFGTAGGLPSVSENSVYRVRGEARFATRQGVFRFDEKGGAFGADPRFAHLFPDRRRQVGSLNEDPSGRVWMYSHDDAAGLHETGAAVAGDASGYRWDSKPLRLLTSGIWVIHSDEDGVVWLGGDDGLFRYDPRAPKNYDQGFRSLVRRVGRIAGEGVVFDGAGPDATPVLDYGQNALRFEYSASGFEAPEALRFQVFLEGNDRDWSSWTADGFRDYTNLREGAYRLRVRARDLYGTLSDEALYAFEVSPPWYRTTWAYVADLLALTLLGFSLVQWRVRRVKAEKRALEATVAERTLELQASNQSLEEAKLRAEDASRAKSVFLANMSHELRTPLHGVLGFAQLMDRVKERSDPDRQHLATILKSGEHLLSLINEILSLSKIEAGQVELQEAPFAPDALVAGVAALVRVRAEAKDLFVRTEEHDLPAAVVGDEGKLRQILLNLLGNAVKFTERGGVTLRTRWTEGRGVFEVEDTGPGMAVPELLQLFAPFVQTERGRRSQEGSGLGLALSRQFARLMGGDITVASVPGRGSTFRAEVALPRAAEGAEPVPRGDRRRVRSLAPDQPTYRILVVDDFATNRVLLRGLLSAVGFDVREAPGGAEAIAIWREWRPDLVWMDKRMPGMDGLEATRRIREEERLTERPRVPIIALSASALDHERTEILSAGCDDFVPKPFREGAIFEKLAEHLGVAYLYEEARSSESALMAGPVTRERLSTLGESWRRSLRDALATGDMDAASALAREIADQDPQLAHDLLALLGAFRLDELQDALGTGDPA